jgi:riboflavin biosynthesis pyrimidine reductase
MTVLTDWRGRFRDFVARREREAEAATIAPLVTEIDRGRGEPDFVAIGNEWTRRLFDGDFYASSSRDPELPETSLVFVQSRDGNTGASDPSTLGGGEADKHLIYEGLSRVAADAVMAGANTVRGGRIVLSTWRAEMVALRTSLGLPRHPVQIVATLRGMPLEGMMFNLPELPVIIITRPDCAELMLTQLAQRPWISPVMLPGSGDLRPAFRELRRAGIGRISCIGGRTLAGQLIDAGLVQDVYLTTSAKEGGEPGTPLSEKPLDGEPIVRKNGTGPDAGVVFEHLHLKKRVRPTGC